MDGRKEPLEDADKKLDVALLGAKVVQHKERGRAVLAAGCMRPPLRPRNVFGQSEFVDPEGDGGTPRRACDAQVDIANGFLCGMSSCLAAAATRRQCSLDIARALLREQHHVAHAQWPTHAQKVAQTIRLAFAQAARRIGLHDMAHLAHEVGDMA